MDVAQHEFTVPNPRNMRGKVEALQKAMTLMMNDIDGRAIDQLGRLR